MQTTRGVHPLIVDGFAGWEPALATAHLARPAPPAALPVILPVSAKLRRAIERR